MDDCCDHCHAPPSQNAPPGYRMILWIALIANAAMFAVEVIAGLASGSVSLQADALDFLGDAANYGISLFVLGLGLRVRASASLMKASSMALFGIWVLATAVWRALHGVPPEPMIMTTIGGLALAVNMGVALLLFRWRDGDSNMRSVWLCTRNDAIGNLAVLAAAAGVLGTDSAWPDLVVAAIMAALALSASIRVARQAMAELKQPPVPRFVQL